MLTKIYFLDSILLNSTLRQNWRMGHGKCWFLMVIVFIAHATALTLRDCRFGTQGCAGKGCLRFCEYVVCSQVDSSICFCSRCGYRTMGAGTRSKYKDILPQSSGIIDPGIDLVSTKRGFESKYKQKIFLIKTIWTKKMCFYRVWWRTDVGQVAITATPTL